MFFGRRDAIQKLEELRSKNVASLVTCRGRRRIGKSTLIEEFARQSEARFIKIEGIRPTAHTTNEQEIANFCGQLANQTTAERSVAPDWLSAFIRLDKELDERFTVVLLDEISWMGGKDALFADYLKIAWDNHWKKHERLILVLCGSVSSWIKDNVIDNSAFYGRRSTDLVVRELPLNECVKFWQAKLGRIDIHEIIDVLSVTGGVPRYLEEVNPSLSAEENICRLCFRPDGLLRVDFGEMFNDVITRQPNFTGRVLRSLVDGPKTAAEVARHLGIEVGGRISDALASLEEAGIVRDDSGINPETGDEMRERRHRLSDNYSRFYLKCIEPNRKAIDSGSYEFVGLRALEEYDGIMGFQFENLVINNYRELIPFLHLDGSLITSAVPYCRRGSEKKRGRKGCQVDLLIQTRGAQYFVEVKHQREIDRRVITEVDEKVRAIRRPNGVSARTALVYEGQLSPLVEADGYFDAIIPFRKLLETDSGEGAVFASPTNRGA